MTTHAIKTTQNEIDNGYRELGRLLQGGQGALAVKHAFFLAKTMQPASGTLSKLT
jgi:hypothetical protein